MQIDQFLRAYEADRESRLAWPSPYREVEGNPFTSEELEPCPVEACDLGRLWAPGPSLTKHLERAHGAILTTDVAELNRLGIDRIPRAVAARSRQRELFQAAKRHGRTPREELAAQAAAR